LTPILTLHAPPGFFRRASLEGRRAPAVDVLRALAHCASRCAFTRIKDLAPQVTGIGQCPAGCWCCLNACFMAGPAWRSRRSCPTTEVSASARSPTLATIASMRAIRFPGRAQDRRRDRVGGCCCSLKELDREILSPGNPRNKFLYADLSGPVRPFSRLQADPGRQSDGLHGVAAYNAYPRFLRHQSRLGSAFRHTAIAATARRSGTSADLRTFPVSAALPASHRWSRFL